MLSRWTTRANHTKTSRVADYMTTPVTEIESDVSAELVRVRAYMDSVGVVIPGGGGGDVVEQSLALMQSVHHTTVECQQSKRTNGWVQWAKEKVVTGEPVACTLLGKLSDLCRLTRRLIIRKGGARRSLPEFCIEEDFSTQCMKRCVPGSPWEGTLFCEQCKGTRTARWISRLKLSTTVAPGSAEGNLFFSAMIIAGNLVTRYKVFTAKEATMYDRINLDESRLDEQTTFVAAMLSDAENSAEDPLVGKFIQRARELLVGTSDMRSLQTVLARACFVRGYQEMGRSRALKAVLQTLGVDTHLLRTLMYKVFQETAYTWSDLDDMFGLFENTFFKLMIDNVLSPRLEKKGIYMISLSS